MDRGNEEGKIIFPVPENVKIPWFNSDKRLPKTLEYFDGTMYEKVEEIAKTKMPDLNANDIEAAKKIIAGTALQMGIEIK